MEDINVKRKLAHPATEKTLVEKLTQRFAEDAKKEELKDKLEAMGYERKFLRLFTLHGLRHIYEESIDQARKTGTKAQK
jgi:hypothetical protein